ncbi:MAG: single-stranded DNA-binding protein [Limisphaerales bacterium]
MNTCILSGRIHDNATVREGKTKALSFVVETTNGPAANDKKDLVNCVLFKPDRELEAMLTEQGKGLYVELEGRVSSSSLKTNGEKRYNSDVIVRNWTFAVVNVDEPTND